MYIVSIEELQAMLSWYDFASELGELTSEDHDLADKYKELLKDFDKDK